MDKTIECFGKLDVLVNNHAVQFVQRSILDITHEQMEFTFRKIPASYSAEEVATFGKGTSHVPMDRAGQPCEVSPCYVFLASDDASYMTGQVLHPNGGTIAGS